MRGSGVPEGAQGLIGGTARDTGVPEGAQVVSKGPLSTSPVDLSIVHNDSDQVSVNVDMPTETSSRSGGQPPTELCNNVVRTGSTERAGESYSQSGASSQQSKMTIGKDGVGQGIPLSNSSDDIVSVANSRGRRGAKPLSRLVVGNPEGWHFNRAKRAKGR